MACNICKHPHRAEIEEYLSVVDTPGVTITLKEIAEKFGVVVTDLQVHALMHTPLATISQAAENEIIPSIAADMKKAEAGILRAMADEYFCTLRMTGKEIRSRMVPVIMENGTAAMRNIPKEIVDLYIGTGNNLRQTVATIVEMNQKINGESDPALESLKGLVREVREVRSEPGSSDD